MPRRLFPDTPEGVKAEFEYRCKQIFSNPKRKNLGVIYRALCLWAKSKGLQVLDEDSEDATTKSVDKETESTPVLPADTKPTPADKTSNSFMDDITERGK